MTHSTPPSPSSSPRRILLIRPSALGDVCRTVPVLVSLKRAFPQAQIDWLVHESYAAAVSAHPDLNRIVPFPRRRFAAWWRPGVAWQAMGWMRDLRRAGYDLVLDCQGLARSALFAWATRAPDRIGYADARELGWLGLTRRVEAPRSLHTVDRMLRLAEAAGAEPVRDMRLYAPEPDRAAVRADPRLAGQRYALLAPTSRWPGKRWPAEPFAAAAARLLDDRALGLDGAVLVGAASERDQCGPLLDLAARDGRIIDRIGATGVGGLMALVESAALVIANDSAALHMAVGFDRPLVSLFGPTRVELVGPYRREASVIQHVTPADRLDHKDEAAGRALMERITVDEVVTAASAALRPRPEPVALGG